MSKDVLILFFSNAIIKRAAVKNGVAGCVTHLYVR